MSRLKSLVVLATLSLLGGCLDAAPEEAVTEAGEQVPYSFRLPDGRHASGVGVRRGDTILVDGDVVIPADASRGQVTQLANAAHNLWPSQVIPYEFDPAVDAVTRQKVLSATGPWTQAGFSFQPRTSESSYVRIRTAYYSNQQWVCGATIGLQPPNVENAYYAGTACRTRDYVHEWGHIIGLFHEHCRNDRDQYVITSQCSTVGAAGYEIGPYDFDSIMHYDAYGRSNGNIDYSNVIIQPRDGRSLDSFGFNDAPSPGDLEAVQAMYTIPTRPLAPVGVSTNWDGCYGRNRVSWTSASSNVQYFEAQKRPNGSSPWTSAYSGAATSFIINVTATTRLQVRACNWVGCSAYSEAPVATYYNLCPVP
ncbi:hypothetical protein MFUL124B02_31360 [Myxococcus fulvus 124B02]|nr:hypothetical protein MFUL124B02_31360 [Myxococcus fulvus 124B02]